MGAWVFGNGQGGSATDFAVYVNSWVGPSIDKSLVYGIFFQLGIISFTSSSSTPSYSTTPALEMGAVFMALYLSSVQICWQKGKKI